MHKSGNLRYALSVLFKYHKSILGILIITIATVTAGTFLMSPAYESVAVFMVKFGREYLYLPEVGNSSGPYNYFDREKTINTELAILNSADLIDNVVEKIGVDNLYPNLLKETTIDALYRVFFKEKHKKIPIKIAAAKLFLKNLTVLGSDESNVIKVSFQHEDAAMASLVLNTYIDLYKEKHLETFLDPNASKFFHHKVEDYRNQLLKIQKKIESYHHAHPAFSMKDQQELYTRQRDRIESRSKEVKNQIVALMAKGKSLESQLGKMSASTSRQVEVGQYEVIDNAEMQLLTLQTQEAELSQKYIGSHPNLVSVREKIELVKRFIQNQKKQLKDKVYSSKSEVYQELEKDFAKNKADLQAKKAEIAVLEKQIIEVDQTLRTLATSETELSVMDRELTEINHNYMLYKSKLDEMQISNDMDKEKLTNIRLIQNAETPISPVRPKKIINLAVGLMLGLFASLGFAVVSEYFNHGLNYTEQVEDRLGLPVLAAIANKRAVENGRLHMQSIHWLKTVKGKLHLNNPKEMSN